LSLPDGVLSGDEYRIYSVGRNGMDEGGTVKESGDKGDIFMWGHDLAAWERSPASLPD
jgi:hypothetical protein